MKKTAIVIALSLALGGCPNPFDQAQQDAKQTQKLLNDLGKLHTYLTNSPLAQFQGFSEAWVTLHKVEVSNSTDNSNAVLFDQPAGKSVNITRRDGIAELLSLAQAPSGTYDTITVTLGRSVTVVFNDGTSLSPTLGSGTSETITVTITPDVAINLAQNALAGFALMFDLASFVPDNAGNILNPIIKYVDPTTLQRLYGELHGTITAIDLVGNTVNVRLADGTVLTLQIPSFATLLDEASKLALRLADLKVGDIVQFFGNYNANQLRMEILSLLVNPVDVSAGTQTQVCATANHRAEVEGYVVSYTSGTLVLDLEESSFLPDGDRINVIALGDTATVYTRGSEAMLTAGQEVEIRGSWDCSNLSASVVEIKGAPSNASLVGSGHESADLAEVKGQISAAPDLNNVLALSINSSEHFSLASGSVNVNVSNAWFKLGNASCLTVGASVEVKGVEVAGPTLQASSVEVYGCGTGTLPDDPAFDHDSEESDDTTSDSGAHEASEGSELED